MEEEQGINNAAAHPGWLEISIDIDPVAREACSAFLIEMGCDGVVSEDFNDTVMKAYVPNENNVETVRLRVEAFLSKITEAFPDISFPDLNIKIIENQDWSTTWRSFFYLERITDNLMILPAWEEMPEPTESHVIRINPGTAFGTGKHETTRMCLKAIEENCRNDPWSMLDVGTGSGILSIYGAMLGAGMITAIDIDPEAVRWAKKNIDLNRLPIEIELSTAPLEVISGTYDIIAANIILNTILALNRFFPGLLAPEGRLILSGILKEQVGKAGEDLLKHGLVKTKEMHMGEWACLVVKKKQQ